MSWIKGRKSRPLYLFHSMSNNRRFLTLIPAPMTIFLFRSILTLCLLGCMAASAQTPLSVTQGRAAQRAGTRLVDVYYDVSGGTAPYTVTLQGSADGGITWTLPVTTVSGNVGAVTAAGTNRKVTWNAGADWAGQFSSNVKFRVNVTDAATLDGFSLIPAGVFTMGRTSGDTDSNAPPVSVNVSAFFMGKYEVTHSLWLTVANWANANGYDIPFGGGKGANHPVHSISWFDMVKWCNARSQRDGLTPVYTVRGAVMKTGTTAPTANWNASGYRLPTEAEWEKAARGGVSGKRFPWGTDSISHSQANYYSSTSYTYDVSPTRTMHPTYATGSRPYSSPVGSFAANGYGLYDMAGNMWEWCWDWYGASTYVNGATNPRGLSSGSFRVFRGGCWECFPQLCRVAQRGYNTPDAPSGNVGFRMARSSVP